MSDVFRFHMWENSCSTYMYLAYFTRPPDSSLLLQITEFPLFLRLLRWHFLYPCLLIGSFFIVIIVDGAVMNTGVQMALPCTDLFPLDTYLIERLLGHIIVLYLVFGRLSIWFSIVALLICSPTSSIQGSPFLHIFICFNNSHSNRCKAMSHCGFDLYSPDTEWCFFIYLLAICMSSFENVFAHF
jgi:hypothetical protein